MSEQDEGATGSDVSPDVPLEEIGGDFGATAGDVGGGSSAAHVPGQEDAGIGDEIAHDGTGSSRRPIGDAGGDIGRGGETGDVGRDDRGNLGSGGSIGDVGGDAPAGELGAGKGAGDGGTLRGGGGDPGGRS